MKKKGPWLFVGYIGDEIQPNYVGIVINHYKDPLNNQYFMESERFFSLLIWHPFTTILLSFKKVATLKRGTFSLSCSFEASFCLVLGTKRGNLRSRLPLPQ